MAATMRLLTAAGRLAARLVQRDATATNDRWRYEDLVWALRWLAADAEAALTALPDPRLVPDEIALTLEDALLTVDRSTIIADAWQVIDEIDRRFDAMSGQEHAHLWTPEAVRRDRDWAEQRALARQALALLGDERADQSLRGRV